MLIEGGLLELSPSRRGQIESSVEIEQEPWAESRDIGTQHEAR